MSGHPLTAMLLYVLFVAGCASVDPAPTPSANSIDPSSTTATPEMMRSALGFDPIGLPADQPLWDGRRQLFRVTLEDGDRVRTWWMLAGVPMDSKPSNQSMSISMTIDGAEHKVGTRLTPVSLWVQEQGEEDVHISIVDLPLRPPERGTFELCQVFLARAGDGAGAPVAIEPAELTHEQKLLYFECASSLVEMMRVIEGSKDLSNVLWSVVEKPSWIGVLFKGGDIALSISPRFEEVASVPSELPPPLDSLPACRFPMSIDVNGKRALNCEITVCPPGPPLHLTGGIIRLVGTHPTRHDRRVTIDVVGARGPVIPGLPPPQG